MMTAHIFLIPLLADAMIADIRAHAATLGVALRIARRP